MNEIERKMKEELITFETAKLAKEKGFDWACNMSTTHYLDENRHPHDGTSGPFGWEKDETVTSSGYFINNKKMCDFSNESYTQYAVPTQSLLQKWLRDIHKIHITIWYNELTEKYRIDSINSNEPFDMDEYPTYEQVLEIALVESLNLI